MGRIRMTQGPTARTARIARFGAVLALVVSSATGCANCAEGLPDDPEITPELASPTPADDSDGCIACHPRQFREWAGSSHNYGGGIDPVYQALEVTANYYGSARSGRPAVRQSSLCVGCHAPSALSFDADGSMNPNASFRLVAEDTEPFDRELTRPENTQDLLAPPGRVTEAQTAPGLEMEEIYRRRRFTYQGVTCDACHKVGAPFDDLAEQDPRVDEPICREATPECAAALEAQCFSQDPPDPRCRRISREGEHTHPPQYERGISNVGFVFERQGTVRYGPFPAEEMFPTLAHDFSTGATEEARNYVVSFPGEDPPDVRPYLQTSQYCGACHDVRLPTADPVYEESFLRLENLYTEWYRSSLNLHPDSDPAARNPYRDEAGNPQRIVCQDCHMSLFPYAPPGTYPGDYTAGEEDCDDQGVCGETLFSTGALANLRPTRKARVTTHNMSGPDRGLGYLAPTKGQLGLDENAPLPPSLSLPNQRATEENAADPDYGLPMSLEARRKQLLEHSAAISLAGTPELIDPSDRDCSDGSCCDASGNCNLPVKAWLTNVNGGHNVAAGFSQERQMWVELTVQDLGTRDPATGMPRVVDCALGEMSDLYQDETTENDRYPAWPNSARHDVLTANDVINRMFGIPTGSTAADHSDICHGLSGHLIDKPHHETGESVADGRLDDEDVWLHRIGNTTPVLQDGTHLISWHVMDYGLGNDASGPRDAARAGRNDQFHIPGNDAFACELSAEYPEAGSALSASHPLVTLNPTSGATGTISTESLRTNPLQWRVTDTSDERLEILYPYPEFGPLLPSIDNGDLHGGERFGLVYPTNIFYRVCDCPPSEDPSSCEVERMLGGPNQIPGVTGVRAQVPWVATFPVLPIAADLADENRRHFPLSGARELYRPMLENLGLPNGTRASEAFTFVPLNANHMPNNRALKFYEPQRHYWDIRFNRSNVVGPIRVSVRLWFRHFPPEFLRILGRSSREAYDRAVALGIEADLFPNGAPLVVESGAPGSVETGDVDQVERVVVDQAVFFVAVDDPQNAVPAEPTFAADVKPLLDDHCEPCHSDVLRHGGLILNYDDFPEWDDPARGAQPNAHQDPRQNLVGRSSRFLNGDLVVAGDPGASRLLDILESDQPGVRRMPLFTDPISPRERATIRRWIEQGAR